MRGASAGWEARATAGQEAGATFRPFHNHAVTVLANANGLGAPGLDFEAWELPRNFSSDQDVVFNEAPTTMKRMFAAFLLSAAFVAAATPAHADRDAVHFFSNIHVASDATVHDAVCFFCNVNVEGEVQGDAVVFFGNIHIAGKADHDVVNFFGEVSADDNAQIGNDLVSFFGLIRLGENVAVGKDMVAMFGLVRAPDSVTVGHDRVSMPAVILFAPLVLFGLVAILVVREYRAYRRRQFLSAYNFPPRA